MLYVKATVAGILTGLLLGIVAIAIDVLWSMQVVMQTSGSGGIGSVSIGAEIPGPFFLLGFAAGFYMTIRRARRRRLATDARR